MIGNKLIIDLKFEIENLAIFQPHIEILFNELALDLNLDDLDRFVFQYGLVESISYWKATCSKNYQIDCGTFEKGMIPFWKKLFHKGLGEFRYINGIQCSEIDFINFIFEPSKNKITNSIPNHEKFSDAILPIGGGKDSLVSLDILQKQKIKFDVFLVNPQKSTLQLIANEEINPQNIITVQRSIDKNLLKLNSEGFLNGHTPFSAMLAFLLNICAVAKQRKYLILSNESSANEGNAKIIDEEINHQYSKSLEFELDFANFNNSFLSKNIIYFSLLRTLSELNIAQRFSALNRFFPHFRSCNAGRKIDCWCSECPKCLFVWIILSPFLSHDKLMEIFKNNIWDSHELIPTFDALIGLEDVKPFECVGTVSEVNMAIKQVIKNRDNSDMPLLLRRFSEKASSIKNIPEIENNYGHNIPEPFLDYVK
ncbi:MAG: hypothetical protein COA79_10530 [Planctomycetota bacterium]|nr:MAG: hypothetical protein COA79_10530 [Planctomycetota bacterium]